jgi:hypothetical protein
MDRQAERRANKQISLFGSILVLLTCTFVLFRGCAASPEPAKEALEVQGFSEIEIVDHDWLFVGVRGCGGYDSAKFEAKAVNPLGKKVDVTVCAGWPFGGYTVRL